MFPDPRHQQDIWDTEHAHRTIARLRRRAQFADDHLPGAVALLLLIATVLIGFEFIAAALTRWPA